MAKNSDSIKTEEEYHTAEEAASRREEALKRMLSTAPKPHKTIKTKRAKRGRPEKAND
jgi:hypothetical protein